MPSDRPGTGRHILWAEDNPQDRMLIDDAAEGVAPAPDLTLVADGVLLLEALEAEVPALVVLDLKMPRLGGLETLRRMRGHADWRGLPVIIFSSGNRPEEIDECRALGAANVVQKPVDFDLFSSAVQDIVRAAQP